ncbi:MAG: carboxyl transferase domain-containing protein [Acutalibacteraceae bacterium]
MSIEKLAQAKAEISKTEAYKVLTSFFDEGSFCEIDPYAKSSDSYCEAVAGFGTVAELPVYAFCQNSDINGGAMSKAQAAKIKKIYDLALKTGAPVVGFYDSLGGSLSEKSDLLASYGTVLNASANLAGVVPQISVVLGTCLGVSALTANSADFVILSEKADFSVDTKKGGNDSPLSVALKVDDTECAISAAKELVTYMPSNNLSMAPLTEEISAPADAPCRVCLTMDEGTDFKLYKGFGTNSNVGFARLKGEVVGMITTDGSVIEAEDATKIAKIVRFCDAFSIPVVSFVDAQGFDDLMSATKVASAYAEATTAKISVITGTAIGAVYIAMAGTGSGADLTFALPDTVVSPVSKTAAALVLAPEKMDVSVAEQEKVAEEFAKTELSAFKAAENGYIEDIITEEELRDKLSVAVNMLSGKRVNTLPKKHSTI